MFSGNLPYLTIKCYILAVCPQMLQRVVMLAAESLKVLEHQLMDGGQIQDVRVGIKHLKSSQLLTTPFSS